MLRGDRIHLGSVLHNLVDNALKYAGETAEVKVTLKEKSETIEIQVEDNGPGIPKEYRDQVFEKFFRVPAGDKHTVKGYGLGLNYVWNIVKQHGGSVRLENSPEKGSVFIVTLKKKA
jgi:two-component system phosphate regulon sensor histidine kinase PhoR